MIRRGHRTTAAGLAALVAAGCAGDLERRGRAALARGDVAEAVDLLERAVRRDPDDPELRARLAEAYLRAGRPDEARTEAGRAHRASGDPAHLLLRGRAAVAAGDPLAGRRDIVAAVHASRDPALLLAAAAALVRLDAPDDAARAARRAVRAPGAPPAAVTSAVVVLAEAGRPEEAYALALDGIDRHGDHVPLLVAAGALAVRTGHLRTARRIYERLRRIAPHLDAVDQALALVAFELGDLEAARRYARSAVARRGDRDPAVHYTLVVVLEARGEHDAASKALRAALRRFPGDPDLAALAAGHRGPGRDLGPGQDRPAEGVVEPPGPRGRAILAGP